MFLRKNVRGVSLIETIIASLLAMIAAFGAAFMMARQKKAIAHAAMMGESIDVARYVRDFMDCPRTFVNLPADPTKLADCAAASKASNRYIELRDDADVTLISRYTTDATAQILGNVRIRARCVWQSGFHGVLIEYKKDGKNPMTGQPDTWKYVASEVPFACP